MWIIRVRTADAIWKVLSQVDRRGHSQPCQVCPRPLCETLHQNLRQPP